MAGNATLYTGRTADTNSGLHYFRARYFSSTSGQFVSRDPAIYIDSPSPYLYVRSKPFILIDPTGLFGIEIGDNSELSFDAMYADLTYVGAGISYTTSESTDGCPVGSHKAVRQGKAFAKLGIGLGYKVKAFKGTIGGVIKFAEAFIELGFKCDSRCLPCHQVLPDFDCCGDCVSVGIVAPPLPLPLGIETSGGIGIVGIKLNLNWKFDVRICYYDGVGCERKGLHAAICGSFEGSVEIDYLFLFSKFAKIDGTACAGGGEGGWIFGDDDGVDW